MRLKAKRQQVGTLLLDTLTALATIAIIFTLTYPNYVRGIYEAQVASEAAQLQFLAAVTVEYANDHHGVYPPSTGYPLVSTTMNNSSYITTVPGPATNPYTPGGTFYYSPNPDDGAAYEILDGTSFGVYSTLPALDISYYAGTYVRHDGTPCQVGDYFAIDNIHGLHCTQAGH